MSQRTGSVFIERISAGSIGSATDIKDSAESLVSTFLGKVELDNADFRLQIDLGVLNLYAQKHSESWVEKIDHHFGIYTAARRTPTLRGGGSTVPIPFKKLKYKRFSGDVSGVIGEALMVYLLSSHYGVSQSNITHLRGTKSTGVAPDFYVNKVTRRLSELMDPSNQGSVRPPVLAEAKGATNMNGPDIRNKLEKALSQIAGCKAAFDRQRVRYGLAGIFVRDYVRQTYHCLLTVIVR